MELQSEDMEIQSPKCVYEKPTLTKYGSIKELTLKAAGSPDGNDREGDTN